MHPYQPGDYVMTKVYETKDALQPKWEGPVQVLLCTYSPLKVAGKDAWIYHSGESHTELPAMILLLLLLNTI